MRIVDIREKSVDISRYRDPKIPSGELTTSIVALVTDVVRNGKPVIGYGFSSIGRFAQSGLIRERFAPRLLAAGDVDPLTAWTAMMKGEKPGGHGERASPSARSTWRCGTLPRRSPTCPCMRS
jgi:D(-)-tartrate dehydratase